MRLSCGSFALPGTPMTNPPRTLGNLGVLRRIGAGGMAEVFLAEKRGAQGTSKRVVVKRISPGQQRDARLYAMFVREARLATGLDHPNIVQVFELVDHPQDGLLLVMEYVEGADLAHLLRTAKERGETIPPYVAALIAREVAKGLHHVHESTGAEGARLEIVHRDVSPQNILLSRHGVVKLGDLGIATARLYRDATTGVKGKLRYMSPEQIGGAPLDRRADIYALGVVLYEMLRLESPYGARAGDLPEAVRAGRFDPPLDRITDVPAELLAVVRRALELEPAERYPTAHALAEALSRALVAQGRIIDESAIATLVRAVIEAPPEPHPDATETAPVDLGSGAPPDALVDGARLGRYRIEGHLGRGGMADVYAARDTTLDREVALKILHGVTDQRARGLLLREAKLAARFEHPGSVVIYDVGESGGVGFIAMERVRGALLADFIGDPGVPLERRVRWLVGVARVLGAAHSAGLVHLDIKPGNLMIREGGEVKVLDFGIARAFAPRGNGPGEASTSGGLLGTLRYTAPERFGEGPVDGRADQFSWGVTAWELLAGRHPWDDAPDISGPPPVPSEAIRPLAAAAPGVPESIARVVDRALAGRPDERFGTMDEVAAALQPFAEAVVRIEPTPASGLDVHVTDRAPSRAPRPRRRKLWAMAAGALLSGAAVAGAVMSHRQTATVVSAMQAPEIAPEIDALGCSDAIIEGEGGADLEHAIGMAACARLSPEIGVDWAVPSARHRLRVRAELHPDRATVTLSIAGREATGSGPSPIAAIASAVAALAPQLRTPPWSPERIRLWGARDEASARRIWRVCMLAGSTMPPNLGGEIARLLQSDGDSPMTHLVALASDAGGREELAAAPAHVLERLDRVPPARAGVLRAFLLVFPAERDREEATRLLREAYAAAPDDHVMTAQYAALAVRLGLPEADELIERLHLEAPTALFGPVNSSLNASTDRDVARNDAYFRWLGELLPETRGGLPQVRYLVSMGRFEEARTALELTRRLGLDEASGDPFHAAARATVEIAALAPAAAREHANVLLADPRVVSMTLGGFALSASFLLEGRVAEALAAMQQSGEHTGTAMFHIAALRLRRWLKLPPAPALRATLVRLVTKEARLRPLIRLEAVAELGLAGTRKAAEEALHTLEEAARAADGEPAARDQALVLGVALTRILRGDRAAAALWERTARAPDVARCSAALDAALALEAIGDDRGAEAAYLLAERPGNSVEYTGPRMLAMARLARLHRRNGRATEAAEREATLARLWHRADPGLRGAIDRMR